MTIIIFLIVLTILVFVHELGHFLAAKMSGIRVDEFAIGFPPKLFSKKVGETTYSINLIPFGGFVKIHGENGENPDEPESVQDKSRSFVHKHRLIQVWVLIAGIVFNILFAWLIVSAALSFGLPPLTESMQNNQYLKHSGVIVSEVSAGSPSEKAGIKSGDRILRVEVPSQNLSVFRPEVADPVYEIIASSSGNPLTFLLVDSTKAAFNSYDEFANARAVTVTPSYDINPGKPAVGIRMYSEARVVVPFPYSFVEGARVTYDLTKDTGKGLITFFGNILSGHGDFSQVSGPVGIASVVGSAFYLGFTYLVALTALISINLALINLVPLPALDGGRIVIVIIEGIIRRPLPQKAVMIVQVASFILLILLMIAVTVKDVLGFFK